MTRQRIKAKPGATAWFATRDGELHAIAIVSWNVRVTKANPIPARDPPAGSYLAAYRVSEASEIIAWGPHGLDCWRLLNPTVLQRSFARLTPDEREAIAAIRTRIIPVSAVQGELVAA